MHEHITYPFSNRASIRRCPWTAVIAGTLAMAVAGCGDDGSTTVTPDAKVLADAAAAQPDATAAMPDAAPTGPAKTANLEAAKVTDPPNTAFWDGADYAEFTASSTGGNGSTGQAYGGEFNMTGSKDGFDVTVRMKAAYTATDVYIWAQWHDHSNTNDVNRRRWFFNSGTNPVLPTFPDGVTGRTFTETVPSGWSSNLNDDKIGVMWDIKQASVGASATDGRKFADVGCAITCHAPSDMYPDIGRTDLWHWKTSRSNPLGFVNDQYCDPAVPGRKTDTGETIEVRNVPPGGNNTSGPAVVWDPTKQNRIVRAADGATFDLDPLIFLANTATMPIEGDASAGKTIFDAKCVGCHQADGKGVSKDLANFGLNDTRAEIVNKFNASGVSHGGGNQGITDATDQGNLVARIRAFAGAPGYTVQDVTAPDDATYVTNADTVYSDGTYTVIIKRKLVTAKATEDVQFTDVSASAQYPFSVAIMDYDGKNHAGSPLQKLTFKP